MADYNVNKLVKVSGLKAVAERIKSEMEGLANAYAPLAEFTTVKTKVNGIEDGAQVNKIESITIDGTSQAITNKGVALDLSDYVLKREIVSALNYKGSVANFAALPANAAAGDIYNVTAAGGQDENGTAIKAGDNVIKTATGWDSFGGTVDLSGYVEKVAGKQLSTEDYTTAEKTKLAGVEEGAQVNLIEAVQVNGTALAISGKTVNVDISGKMDKVTGATQGNIVTFGTGGTVTDSGLAVASDTDITAMITEVFGAAS